MDVGGIAAAFCCPVDTLGRWLDDSPLDLVWCAGFVAFRIVTREFTFSAVIRLLS